MGAQNTGCFSAVVYSLGSHLDTVSLWPLLAPGSGQAPKVSCRVCLQVAFVVFPRHEKGSWSLGRGPCSHIPHSPSLCRCLPSPLSTICGYIFLVCPGEGGGWVRHCTQALQQQHNSKGVTDSYIIVSAYTVLIASPKTTFQTVLRSSRKVDWDRFPRQPSSSREGHLQTHPAVQNIGLESPSISPPCKAARLH